MAAPEFRPAFKLHNKCFALTYEFVALRNQTKLALHKFISKVFGQCWHGKVKPLLPLLQSLVARMDRCAETVYVVVYCTKRCVHVVAFRVLANYYTHRALQAFEITLVKVRVCLRIVNCSAQGIHLTKHVLAIVVPV